MISVIELLSGLGQNFLSKLLGLFLFILGTETLNKVNDPIKNVVRVVNQWYWYLLIVGSSIHLMLMMPKDAGMRNKRKPVLK